MGICAEFTILYIEGITIYVYVKVFQPITVRSLIETIYLICRAGRFSCPPTLKQIIDFFVLLFFIF